MKRPLFLIAFLFLFLCVATLSAQQKPYFAAEGTVLKYDIFDSKNKLVGSAEELVRKVYQRGDTLFAESVQTETITNGSKTTVESATFKAYKLGRSTYFIYDLAQMLGEDEEFEKEMSESGLKFNIPVGELSPDMKPGAKLADLMFEFGSDLVEKMPFEVKMGFTDRTIDGFETVVTPAGEFRDCIRLTQTFRIKMGIIKKKLGTSTEWYAPGIGVVKSELRSGKKVQEMSVLKAITVK